MKAEFTWKDLEDVEKSSYERGFKDGEASAKGLKMARSSDVMLFLEEKQAVSEAMISFGGGFVRRLGEALTRADYNNARVIKRSFGDYWNEYLRKSKK